MEYDVHNSQPGTPNERFPPGYGPSDIDERELLTPHGLLEELCGRLRGLLTEFPGNAAQPLELLVLESHAHNLAHPIPPDPERIQCNSCQRYSKSMLPSIETVAWYSGYSTVVESSSSMIAGP